jgi:hypothetical protein
MPDTSDNGGGKRPKLVTEQRRDGRVGNPGRPVALAKDIVENSARTRQIFKHCYTDQVTFILLIK